MTHYETLGVNATATDAEIKTAYRVLAKKYHPDVNKGDQAAEQKFKEISAAYDTLKDAGRRAQYDQEQRGGSFSAGFSDYHNIHDIMNELFRNQRGYRNTPANQDINIQYEVELHEVYEGKNITIKFMFNNVNREACFSVPTHTQTGNKIRLKGQGDHSNVNLPAGDIIVTFVVRNHAVFGRRDATTLQMVKTIDYLDAILGH